ncbi:MAG: RdgB/HAM1 family non-canonical purine NTP pyrophosphatase [Verrucomicrobiaceae bacterium]|nr:RdgB/HAM1 family non-canonical purine NTP pyrophosphatase [Verrucomicrobiaceae bacterium]
MLGTLRLVVASGNAHKTAEIRRILGDFVESVEDLSGYPEIEQIEETGVTFEENAEIKALAVGRVLADKAWILSDDSGLEVDALGGEPGVYSARYAGENASDVENRERLLEQMSGLDARSARFRCVMVLARGGQKITIFEGVVEGVIARAEKGERGFGYDSLFIPEGYSETFGELSPEVKNSMSHRGRALEQFKLWLTNIDHE